MLARATRCSEQRRHLVDSKTYSLDARGLPDGLGQDLTGSLYYEGDCPDFLIKEAQIWHNRPCLLGEVIRGRPPFRNKRQPHAFRRASARV